MALRGKLITDIACSISKTSRRVTVVGAGKVGMAIVACLLGQGITNDIVLVDTQENLVKGEINDLRQGSGLINNAHLSFCTDYKCTENSELCIIAAGAKERKTEDRLSSLPEHKSIIQEIVKKLITVSPETTLLLATNPVDVLTYIAWKESGLPVNKVIGSGTTLDSNRFRCFIAERLGVSPAAVYAAVIGEHGRSAVPCWSGVTIGNTNISKTYPDFGKENDKEKWFELRKQLVGAAYEIMALKGATWWGVALCTSYLAGCILDNTLDVTPVSTNVNGFYGITDDVFLSLPCILGLNGIQGVINQNLSEDECKALQISAQKLLEAQKSTGM